MCYTCDLCGMPPLAVVRFLLTKQLTLPVSAVNVVYAAYISGLLLSQQPLSLRGLDLHINDACSDPSTDAQTR